MSDKTKTEVLFLTPQELSDRWKISTVTLGNQRSQGRGMPYTKLGKNIRYRMEDIVEHEEAARRCPMI